MRKLTGLFLWALTAVIVEVSSLLQGTRPTSCASSASPRICPRTTGYYGGWPCSHSWMTEACLFVAALRRMPAVNCFIAATDRITPMLSTESHKQRRKCLLVLLRVHRNGRGAAARSASADGPVVARLSSRVTELRHSWLEQARGGGGLCERCAVLRFAATVVTFTGPGW
jgi:hypothetical protein